MTNSGLAKLQSLKNLTDIDVATAGLHRMVSKRCVRRCPPAKVGSMARSSGLKLAGAAKPADSSTQAIAAWVKAMGGSAELVSGRLTAINLVIHFRERRAACIARKSPRSRKAGAPGNAGLGSGLVFRRRLTNASGTQSEQHDSLLNGTRQTRGFERISKRCGSRDAGRGARPRAFERISKICANLIFPVRMCAIRGIGSIGCYRGLRDSAATLS